MPRLFRESPLHSIWEGSGNVQALDVLRAMVKSPAATRGASSTRSAPAAEPSRGSTRFGAALARPSSATRARSRRRARRLVERMALPLQGSLLVRYGDPAVADAFCATRLDGDWGNAFGTLPAGRRHRRDRRAPCGPDLRLSRPSEPVQRGRATGSTSRSRDHVAEVRLDPPGEAQRARLRDVRGDRRRRSTRSPRDPVGAGGRPPRRRPSFCSGPRLPELPARGARIEDMFERRDGEDANLAQRVAYGWQLCRRR